MATGTARGTLRSTSHAVKGIVSLGADDWLFSQWEQRVGKPPGAEKPPFIGQCDVHRPILTAQRILGPRCARLPPADSHPAQAFVLCRSPRDSLRLTFGFSQGPFAVRASVIGVPRSLLGKQ